MTLLLHIDRALGLELSFYTGHYLLSTKVHDLHLIDAWVQRVALFYRRSRPSASELGPEAIHKELMSNYRCAVEC